MPRRGCARLPGGTYKARAFDRLLRVLVLPRPGGLAEIATLDLTGDLAVTNLATSGSSDYGNIAIYKDARGTPTLYSSPTFPSFYYCAYDDAGNLFADDPSYAQIAELPKGGSAITEITLNRTITPGSIQWSGNALAVADGCCGTRGALSVYQVQVNGSSGTVSGPTLLWSKGNRKRVLLQLWIQGKTIVGPDHGTASRTILNFGSTLKAVNR